MPNVRVASAADELRAQGSGLHVENRAVATDVIGAVSRGSVLAALTASVVALLALLFVVALLIEHRPFFGRPFWALVDSGVHGLVALLITTPILQSWQLLVLAFLAGTLVDADHFLAVGGRSFWAATQLEKRPPTHSVTFALVVGGGGYLFSGSLATAWIVFAALTSHVLRDASVGTAPVLWPLGDWRIARWVYYVGEVGLMAVSLWLLGAISRDSLTYL